MSHHLLLIIHLISATIWVGGHLYMIIRLLPGILKRKDVDTLLQFEKTYEPMGMPSLVLLLITGFWMSFQFGIGWTDLFHFSTPVERVVSIKLLLLIATLGLALSARLRIFPQLKKSPKKLPELAIHAIGVTLIGVTMLILGSFIRYGGF